MLNGSVEEATSDMAGRGHLVTVIKCTKTFLEQIRCYRGAQREKQGARGIRITPGTIRKNFKCFYIKNRNDFFS